MSSPSENAAALEHSSSYVKYFSAEGWDDSFVDTVESFENSDGIFHTPKSTRALFVEGLSSSSIEDTTRSVVLSTHREHGFGACESDMSEASVVEHGMSLPIGTGSSFSNYESYRIPKKIIITLRFSDLLRYPLLRLSNCISVLRFQRSLLDETAGSDSVYRRMKVVPSVLSVTSISGLLFMRDFVKAYYKRYGWKGFYRGFSEYLLYRFYRDVMKYIVPRFIVPRLSAFCGSLYHSALSVEPASVSHLRNRYLKQLSADNDSSGWKKSSLYKFIERNIRFDSYRFFVDALVELFTYPLLTLSCRMMIYDGPYVLNTWSLFNSIVTWDGYSTLYSGFTWHMVSLVFDQLTRNYQRKHSGLFMGRHASTLDQCVPFLLTVGSTVSYQVSLAQRCMSSMDGFCMPTSSLSALSAFPWMTLFVQMGLAAWVMRLKDKLET
ncbi:putative integral membrane protein [Babesia bovis T2Bo]|uniref:Uncharacterized protein n=1 Tax=Babesia bovis TaxID=5865 RepID=A7ANZ5_BABBO|nr:putative integral membrane protein [Babesia bovis T2Bo]EDO08279.1 putative integral membrane protein [Babesia bovis T2Bo]|eukprot:XP_001611847.1 hypothetical protein [Babesia bovis T2Bo]